jgi:hypothetical protein
MKLILKIVIGFFLLCFIVWIAIIVYAGAGIARAVSDDSQSSITSDPKIDTTGFSNITPISREIDTMKIFRQRMINRLSDDVILYLSHQFVEPKLANPESAEFDMSKESSVVRTNDTTFQVISNVVSPNSYGVKSRFIYGCTLHYYYKTDRVYCEGLNVQKWD